MGNGVLCRMWWGSASLRQNRDFFDFLQSRTAKSVIGVLIALHVTGIKLNGVSQVSKSPES